MRVREGSTVTAPENGHDPELHSYRLPPPPVWSQAAPNSQWESRPIRSTSFRLLYLFPQSGRSLRTKRKREPYPCGSSSSYQTGQKRKKPTPASEQDEHQRSSPASNQPTTTQQTRQQPQACEESWADEGYVEQERRSQLPVSCSILSPAGETERETVSGKGEYLKRATSSAGTVERTSARRESRLERTGFPRAVQPWLARNSKALDQESISLSKSARTSTGICSRKPPHVDSHQSSQEATSHTLERIGDL